MLHVLSFPFSVESWKKCFDKFYSSGSWEIQTMYVAGHIKSQAVFRRYGKGSLSKITAPEYQVLLSR